MARILRKHAENIPRFQTKRENICRKTYFEKKLVYKY